TERINLSYFRADLAWRIGAIAGCDHQGSACERPFIGSGSRLNDPAFQVECEGPARENPLAIKFASDMHMCTCGRATFTGWIPQKISSFHGLPDLNAIIRRQMQIEQHPARSFIAVFIKVDDH